MFGNRILIQIIWGIVFFFPTRLFSTFDINTLNKQETLFVGLTKNIPDMSGVGDNSVISNQINFLIFDLLFNFNPTRQFEFSRVLIDKVAVDDAFKVWTFDLRRDVKFHNGLPLTADDVKFSIDIANQEDNPRIDFLGVIKTVQVLSPYQFEITLHKPSPRFLKKSLYNVPVIPKQVVEKIGLNAFKEAPVGTGPYKFVHRQKGEHLLLERNETYWGGTPKIKNILIKTNLSSAVLNIEIEAGNLDIVPDTELSNLNLGLLRKKVNISTPESIDYYYFAYNLNKYPTKSIWFRKAILHAFDFDRYIHDLFKVNKGGIRAYSPIPPSLWPQDLDFQKTNLPAFDPQKAEALFSRLEKDKYFNRKDPFVILCRGKRYRTAIMRALAHNLAYHYGFTNIQFKIVPDWSNFQKEIATAHIHSFGMGFDNPDPNIDVFGESPYNYYKYDNKDVKAWLASENKELSKDQRSTNLIKILRKALYEDFIWGMLFHKNAFFLTSKRIQNLVVSGVGYFYIYNSFAKSPISAHIEQ